MYILGIESSCDETSAAVVDMGRGRRKILSNIVASQVDIHRLYGGVVPEIASRAHAEVISGITYDALKTAGIEIADAGAVAVTSHPGLIGALLVGVNFAKSLAFSYGIPLVAVDHIKGHVAATYLSHEDLEPPFLALVVSGGHTSIYDVTSYVDFEEMGSTRDDAAGEAFDKIGRVTGLPYPGGAAMDRLAAKGNPFAVEFPSPAIRDDSLDFSFSGIKTHALNYINTQKLLSKEINKADLAASYTRAVVDGIEKKVRKALDLTGADKLVVAGGVAANSHLRCRMVSMCGERNVKPYFPDAELCGDNAAMIACAGYFEYIEGSVSRTDLNASAT